MSAMVPVALTVAGSDPSGGAGIQADLKTFHQHGVYGAAVISLLTVQNTLGVQRVVPLAAELVVDQLRAVLEDLPVAAMKTGALGDAETVRAVAACCAHHGIRPVVDPVLASKNGSALTAEEARDAWIERLLPQAALVTPNLDELAWLVGEPLQGEAQIRRAGQRLLACGVGAVLVKGGHRVGAPVDLLFEDSKISAIPGNRVDTRHTHGLGCTLSAAICAHLAQGKPLLSACSEAKTWLQRALSSADPPGAGCGSVDHLARLS